MEARLGEDFSQVVLHADEPGFESTRQLDARAYTIGSHIVFDDGNYAPGTPEGERLLAHELGHVVQQHATGPRLQLAPNTDPLKEAMDAPAQAIEGSPDPREATKIGSEGEKLEIEQAKRALRKAGYEVYAKDEFGRIQKSEWLARAYSDTGRRPDLVAISHLEDDPHILVFDPTASSSTLAEARVGDPKRLPNSERIKVDPFFRGNQHRPRDLVDEMKPRGYKEVPVQPLENETVLHIEKTNDDTKQLQRNLPPELKDYRVEFQDKYWRGGASRKIRKDRLPAAPDTKKQPFPSEPKKASGARIPSGAAHAGSKETIPSRKEQAREVSKALADRMVLLRKWKRDAVAVPSKEAVSPKEKSADGVPAESEAILTKPLPKAPQMKPASKPKASAKTIPGPPIEPGGLFPQVQPAGGRNKLPAPVAKAAERPKKPVPPSSLAPSAKAPPKAAAPVSIKRTSPMPLSTPIVSSKAVKRAQTPIAVPTARSKVSVPTGSGALKPKLSRQPSPAAQSVELASVAKAKIPPASPPSPMGEVLANLESGVRPSGHFEIAPPAPGETFKRLGTPDRTGPSLPTPSRGALRNEAGANVATEGLRLLGVYLNDLNTKEQARRLAEAKAAAQSQVERIQIDDPERAVYYVVTYQQVEGNPESPIQPGPVFVRLELAYGRDFDEALGNFADRPRLLPGVPQGSQESIEYAVAANPTRPAAAIPMPAAPFPRVALATFADANVELQDVEWSNAFGFDDEGKSSLAVPAGVNAQFYVLQVPEWMSSIVRLPGDLRIKKTRIPLRTLTTADGGNAPGIGLDTTLPFSEAVAVCIFPADRLTLDLLSETTPTMGHNYLAYEGMQHVRWVPPESIRIVREKL